MAKYQKKPIVIEAMKLDWSTWNEVCDFIGDKFKSGFHGCYLDDNGSPLPDEKTSNAMGLIIPTLKGDLLARQGDYIIKGIKGEFYPCKPDIFEQTYELVEG